MDELLKELERHFEETPKEKILAGWKRVCERCKDDNSPTIEAYFERIGVNLHPEDVSTPRKIEAIINNKHGYSREFSSDYFFLTA